MADKWYLARDNQKHGPYSSAQLREFARSGRILPTDMLLKDGTTKWVLASQVNGLFPPPNPKAIPQAIPAEPPQPVPAAIPVAVQPAADPFQELGGGSPGKAPAASLSPFVTKARNFFTSNWTAKKIAIVGGSAAGVLLLLILLIIALSGGGGGPSSGGSTARGSYTEKAMEEFVQGNTAGFKPYKDKPNATRINNTKKRLLPHKAGSKDDFYQALWVLDDLKRGEATSGVPATIKGWSYSYDTPLYEKVFGKPQNPNPNASGAKYNVKYMTVWTHQCTDGLITLEGHILPNNRIVVMGVIR